MRTRTKLAILFTYILLMATVSVAFAQEDGPEPCSGTDVSGTVVAVDESSGVVTVTVDTGDGLLCTVTLGGGTYAHPIVALLGTYFDDLNAETLVAALEALDTYVVCTEESVETTVCELASPDDEGAVMANVVAVVDNGDGTFTIELAFEGQEEHIFITLEDSSLVEGFTAALGTLMVMWELDESGRVLEVGDQIAAYHEEGMGFGVLTKLYAMAHASMEACAGQALAEGETCGVTVEELVADFQSGTGMGELFKLYGKPSMVGVGHVRKALKAAEDAGITEESETTEPGETTGPGMPAQSNKDKDKDKGNDHSQGRGHGKVKSKNNNKGTPPGWNKSPAKNR